MASATLDVPDLWADHHVLIVRELLTTMNGVSNVLASPARKQINLEFDPAVAPLEAIKGKLAGAGYPVQV